MKKAAKKSVPAKSKAAAQSQTKSAGKSATKPKTTVKKAKSPTKKAGAKSVASGKTTPAAKKPAVRKSRAVSPPESKIRASAPAPAPMPIAAPMIPSAPLAPTLPSSGEGTRTNPWVLKTPPGGSEFQAFRDDTLSPPALVVRVGSTELRYHLRCLTDLHEMLKAYGDWMLLGAADEQKPVVEGTVESWARSPANPVGGWYGLKNGLRGRFGVYVPPVMEVLGLAEVEHFPRDNRMRAK